MLSSYCLLVAHSISTRYASNINYMIPRVQTNRGQNSIKYSGPKVWSQIPIDNKLIAFKKPFSKNMKSHLLRMVEEKSRNLPITYWKQTTDDELQNIFESTGNESTFYGFDFLSLTFLFESDSENSTFLGFPNQISPG